MFPLNEQMEMEHGGISQGEEQVNEDLNSQTIGEGQSYDNKGDARSALLGDAGRAANRLFRDATSKSVQFRIVPTESGGYRLSFFFFPANNPGYGKLYVQEISAEGNIELEYKDTMHGERLIERKYIDRP